VQLMGTIHKGRARRPQFRFVADRLWSIYYASARSAHDVVQVNKVTNIYKLVGSLYMFVSTISLHVREFSYFLIMSG
jgi:hypothetical protein